MIRLKRKHAVAAALVTFMTFAPSVSFSKAIQAEETASYYEYEYDIVMEGEAESEKGTEVDHIPETEAESEADTDSMQEDTDYSEEDTEWNPEEDTEWNPEYETDTEYESEEAYEEETGEDYFEYETEEAYETENETEENTEWESEDESELLEESLEDIMVYAKELPASGTSVASAGGWQIADTFSTDYKPLKFYPGISSLEYFNYSDKVKLAATTFLTGYKRYLYPQASGQEGQFGAIYHNVLYYDHRWMDLKLTVVAYSSEVQDLNGKTIDAFPFIGMEEDRIGWIFNEAFGEIVIKCEILDAQTGAPVSANVRFQWWDIDGAQRFGIKTADGSISGKYYVSGSRVHVLNNQTIQGIGGMEILVAPPEAYPASDELDCITYELNGCSTYYMAFPYRDHIGQPDYSLSEKKILTFQDALAKGDAATAVSEEVLRQTDTSLGEIETPEPQKAVSLDGENWSEDITLEKVTDLFWYKLEVQVPWQDTDYYYSDYVLADSLQDGVKYEGNLRVERVEDLADVSDQFIVTQENNNIQISVDKSRLSNAAFYGYQYRILFQASLEHENLLPEKSDNQVCFSVKNQAELLYRHNESEGYKEVQSNEVITRALMQKAVTPKPIKGIDGEKNKNEKVLQDEQEEIVYSVFQTIPENEEWFYPTSIEMVDELEACLQFLSATCTVTGKDGEEKEETNVKVDADDGKLKIHWDYVPDYNGGEICFQLHCKIRKDADLKAYQKQLTDGTTWTVIPNTAMVTFFWNSDGTEKTSEETNEVLVKYKENLIHLEKEINAEDIVWAHGNPIFTFCISGKDQSGKEHVYYKTVEFTEEDTPTQGKVRKSVNVKVPSGIYTVTEEAVIRYYLDSISEVENGVIERKEVRFDFTEAGYGKAVFTNEKITDQNQSDTAFIENRIH